MRTVFSSWRRKLGCVLLVTACAFTAAWIRSLMVGAYVAIPVGRQAIFMTSYEGSLCCALKDSSAVKEMGEWWNFNLNDLESFFITQSVLDGYSAKAPYWSIVIPLAVIFMYLLLSKPRRNQSHDGVSA